MTEKIKEIVDQFFKEHSSWGTYKYKLDSSYWVKFEFTLKKDHIRVYLGVELPGYQYVTSGVYEIYNGPLNDADKGLAAFIEMQYLRVEKMNNDGISIGYNCYKSVLSDNDRLRDEINHLKKECQSWKDKYFQEKMNHTTTESRIVYAKHILSGNRDKDVVENVKHNFIDRYGEC